MTRANPEPWERDAPAERIDRLLALRPISTVVIRPRSEPAPAVIAHPTGSGCLMCGVAELPMDAGESARYWYPISTTPRALGGHQAPATVRGLLCWHCHDAVELTGSVGPTAIARAVCLYIGAKAALNYMFDVVPWALSARESPNAEPWGHVDLTAVRAMLGMQSG